MDLPLNALALFAGGGGLELGLHLARGDARVVCYVEREAYACEVLASRAEKEDLDSAPIWTDVSTFDGRPWRGVVDLIVGGFPCQDISNAGARAGIGGERSGLWKHFARIIAEVRPRLVFIENVAALVGRGLETVLTDLAALGFDAEWGCLRASDVGAPHGRNRIFILAHAGREAGRPSEGLPESRGGGAAVCAREAEGRAGQARSSEREEAQHRGAELAYSERDQLWHELRRFCRPSREGSSLAGGTGEGIWPAGRDAPREAFRPDLEPSVCRTPDGLANRVERLRLCGNGVVPAQAAFAWWQLAARFDGD